MRRCLFCGAALPGNDVLEHLPNARRVAFDAARGRLWVICDGCGRWNLRPIETRWEAVEELERLTRDRGRLLTQTDNIGLIEVGRLRVVRVGRAERREEAWWRYGEELLERDRRARRTELRGRIMDAVIMAGLIGIPLWSWRDQTVWVERQRRRQLGAYALDAPLQCERCGRRQKGIRFADLGSLRLLGSEPSNLTLWDWCDRCGRAADEAGYRVTGPAALHALRRGLAWANFRGAPQGRIDEAAQLVERAGTTEAMLARLDGSHLGVLVPATSLALEMGLAEARERELVRLEARELERRWREEEVIAAIADRELA